VRNATLQAALAVLVEAGRVFKDRADYANRALIPDSASRDP
jgi:hypothetical protein